MRILLILSGLSGLFFCHIGFCAEINVNKLSGTQEKFNVVLIILDALRPDYLGCYGYPKNTSPVIDALAQESVLFKNAFSTFPLTLPSVVSIFTSLYPSSHEMKHIFKDVLPDRVYTLAQILKVYGYSTAWFGTRKDPQSGSAPGVLRGFDRSYDLKNIESSIEILPWIRKQGNGAFFLTVHSYQTHEQAFPYARFDNEFLKGIPVAFLDEIDLILKKTWAEIREQIMADPEAMDKILDKKWMSKHRDLLMRPYSRKVMMQNLRDFLEGNYIWMANRIMANARNFILSLEGARMRQYLLLSDAAIRETDQELVGRLIKTLKDQGIYDKTVIIITADHGNEYKEHGLMGHGCALYDESLRVPLIIRVPGIKGKVKVDAFAENIDIAPTVCDILGIPASYQMQGVSLRKLWEDESGDGEKEYVISQSIGSDLVAIRSVRWKLIMAENDGEAKELFDLKKDPGERVNVLDVNPGIAKQLRQDYFLKIKGLPRYQKGGSCFLPEIDEKTRENIKKTGYW